MFHGGERGPSQAGAAAAALCSGRNCGGDGMGRMWRRTMEELWWRGIEERCVEELGWRVVEEENDGGTVMKKGKGICRN